MIGILNIAGHQRKLLSLTTSYSKTISKKGYPNSLSIVHFFKELCYSNRGTFGTVLREFDPSFP